MIKKWNRTGKIKAIVLGFLALPNLLAPIGAQGHSMILTPLIFGSIAIPLITKFNTIGKRQGFTKPTWNDNPMALGKPLIMFNFFAYFFLIVGLSILVGSAIKFHMLNNFGLTSISFGLGIFIGIWLALKWTKNK